MPEPEPARLFLLGLTYRTRSGELVRIVGDRFDSVAGWSVRGSDGLWRCDAPSQRGRVLGGAMVAGPSADLIPGAVRVEEVSGATPQGRP